MTVKTPFKEAVKAHPIAAYQGGKRGLSKRLSQIIDTAEHTTYAEPFVGMAGVFLKRSRQPKAEMINDISGNVTNLFRILQRHYPQFLEVLRFQITTRAEFDRLSRTAPDTLTDLERAARFLYLQRTSFGGKVRGQTFGVAVDRPARFNLTALEPALDALHTRLSGVTIENMDYGRFIERYDRPGTLFYLDPPYYGCENDYGTDVFERADFEKMVGQLRMIEGKVLLSLNDRPEVRAIFEGFNQAKVQTKYTLGTGSRRGKKQKPVGELIISNFKWTWPK